MAQSKPSPLHRTVPELETRALAFALFFACLLLAGCAAVENRPASIGPIGAAFHLTGRVSVKFGTEAAGGRFDWEHAPARDDVLISNPLGQGVAHIVRENTIASLTTADQKVYRARDVEALTEEVLGWRLPLAGLPDWVRGRAAAQAPAQTRLDNAGRMAELQQSGWSVEYLDYGSGNGLPTRLRLSRNDVEIRLAIDEWRSLP